MKRLAIPSAKHSIQIAAFAITAMMMFVVVLPHNYANATTITEHEYNDTYTMANTTYFGGTTTGKLPLYGNGNSDEDWYKIQVPANGVLTCVATGNAGSNPGVFAQLSIRLYKSNAEDWIDTASILNFTNDITSNVKKGTYYLRVDRDCLFGPKNMSYSFKLKFKMTEKPSVTSIKSSGNKIKAKWSKASGKGYQIRYSTSKSMKNAKTKVVSSKKFTSKKLKKGKKYYFQVRAYSKAGSKTYYSHWSGKKKVIIAK